MKKKIILWLLNGLAATLPFATVKAQTETLVVYHPIPHTTTVSTDSKTSYKNYVGVYVRAKVMHTFLEAFDDAVDRFHFLDGQRFFGPLEIKQAAERAQVFGLAIHKFRVFLERLVEH